MLVRMLHRLHICVAISLVIVLINLPRQTSGDIIGPMNHEKTKEKPLWSSQFLEFALKKLSLSNGGLSTARKQAIPLAIVQADALASAKQSKKPDKSNSTDNCTICDKHANLTCNNQTIHNNTIQTLHDNKTLNAINKTVHLMNASMDTRDRKSVTRHAGVVFISNITYRENPTTNESSSEDPDKPQNRTKRQSRFRSALHRRKGRIFPFPYVIRPPSSRYTILHPEAEVDERAMRRRGMPNDLNRLFKLSAEGAQDTGLIDNSPIQDPNGVDPQYMQSAYDKRAYWNPVQDQSFSNGDQLNLGSPDHSYRKFVEKEAMNVDRSFSQDFPMTPEKVLLRNLARHIDFGRRSAAPSDYEGFRPSRGNSEPFPEDEENDRESERARLRSLERSEEMRQSYQGPSREEFTEPRGSRDFMTEKSELQPNLLLPSNQKFMLPADNRAYPLRQDPYLGEQDNEMADRRGQMSDRNMLPFNTPIDPEYARSPEIASMFRTVVDPANALFSPTNPIGMPERLEMFRDPSETSPAFIPESARMQEEQDRILSLQPLLAENNVPIMSEIRDPFTDSDTNSDRQAVSSPSNSDIYSNSIPMLPVASSSQQEIPSLSSLIPGQPSLTQQELQNYYFQAMQAQQQAMSNQENRAALMQPFQSNEINRRTMLQSLASVPVVMAVSPQGAVLPTNVISKLLGQTSKEGEQAKKATTSDSNQKSTVTNSTSADHKTPLLTFTPLTDEQAEKVVTEHKELLSSAANGNEKKSEDRKPADFGKELNGQVVTLSLEKAIRDVLADSLDQKKITSEQFSDIEAKVRTIFSDLTKNGTAKQPTNVTVVNATVPTNSSSKVFRTTVVAKKDEGITTKLSQCNDQIKECPRFKEGGVCPFMETFMEGMCTKTCGTCQLEFLEPGEAKVSNPEKKDKTKKDKDKVVSKAEEKCSSDDKNNCDESKAKEKVPDGPSMHLNFDSMESETVVIDSSGEGNNGVLLKGAKVSNRRLGTCGKAAEVNGGDISWSGKDFKKKPSSAVALGMWVKVKKSGSINWFANGNAGKTFYLSTQGTVVPAKVWTHVVGTYDSKTGLSRVFINGDLAQETQQNKGEKLLQDWLVNGIGKSFGDDSIHYVDEIYIYDRALTPTEVHALYSQCQFNRMIIHYGFQRGNTSLMKDQSGLQNDAILLGGATPKEDCDRCGTCLDMTEGPDPTLKIERISLKNLPTTGVSIAFWVSLNSTSGTHDLFVTQGRLDGSGYHLQVVDGKIKWRIGADSGDTIFDYETTGIVVPEALWSHVIVTYGTQTGKARVYVNGVSKLDKTIDKAKRRLLPQDWENEAKIGGKNFNGYMDEFLLYNWDLDESEAVYVRNYCADRPKLVRFTVRVPLTRRNKINNAKAMSKPQWQRRSSIFQPHITSNRKITRSKPGLTKAIHSSRKH